MFFIDKVADWRRKDFFIIHWVPTIIIFLSFISVTLWSWQVAKDRAERDSQDKLNSSLSETADALNSKINSAQDILRAGSLLFTMSPEASRADWKNFTDTFDVQNRYPEIKSIAYVKVVPNPQLSTHTQQVRSEGGSLSGYNIKPAGNRNIYAPVLYLEPSNAPSPLIGFDDYSDSVRREALDIAAASGQPTLTGLINPSAAENEQNPSFGIYYPVYKQGLPPGSINYVEGYIYIAIRNNVLFENLLSTENGGELGYRINDKSGTQTLYQSPNFQTIADSKGSLEKSRELKLQNKLWTLTIKGKASTGTPEIQDRPGSILIGGTILSVMVAGLVYILLISRTRALSVKEEKEIQSAKDELLALASHQLRTPATGVKQYVGMLREGYVGPITPAQMKILDKANESNERQLTTINEMLSVARADAGRLPLEKRLVKLNELIRDTVAEQQQAFDSRQQKLSLHIPKQTIEAEVDLQYLRMAIENIVSNASKYTPERGAIDITLKQEKNSAIISVEDTGVGIPARHYALLFKKFSRIPNDLTNQVSGTGIGLYLAKHIVEAHNGRLTFKSEAGVGSTFSIFLPAKKKKKPRQ